MSTWTDALVTPPADGQHVWFRRWPEVTPPLQGVWAPDTDGVEIDGIGWWLPADLVTRWRTVRYNIPIPSLVGRTGWRDPVLWPPSQGQSCWARRWLGNTGSFLSVWNASTQSFVRNVRNEYTVNIEWYYVWRWKPA